MTKLYVLSKDWARSGKYSGYQKIAKFYQIPTGIVKSIKIPYRLSNYLKKKTKLINYRSETLGKEFRLLFDIFRSKTIHIVYGDMDYYYLHYLKYFPFNLRKNKIIATIHHPPYELERRLQYDRKKVLGALDKIIVMGSNQIPFLEEYTKAQIKFIPHGINTNFFRPPKKKSTRINRVFIFGISHRDHNYNIEVIKAINKRLDVEFLVVMFEEYANKYKNLPNTKIITENIDDQELLYYYQTSKAMLLSLIDCTASNVILEALATGCPLVVNNVGAVKEYIPESSGLPVFENNNIEQTVDYFELLMTDDEFLDSVSVKQIELAKSFEWNKISELTRAFIFN